MRYSENLMKGDLCGACYSRRDQGVHHVDPELRRAYELLGCPVNATDDMIRSRRRALAKDCHADHLPRDCSPEELERANTRFRQIQDAYDLIVKSRNRYKVRVDAQE